MAYDLEAWSVLAITKRTKDLKLKSQVKEQVPSIRILLHVQSAEEVLVQVTYACRYPGVGRRQDLALLAGS